MSNAERIIEKLKKNQTNARFAEIELILQHCGYTLSSKKRSHLKYKKDNCPNIYIVTHNKKVKKWYIKDAFKVLNI